MKGPSLLKVYYNLERAFGNHMNRSLELKLKRKLYWEDGCLPDHSMKRTVKAAMEDETLRKN